MPGRAGRGEIGCGWRGVREQWAARVNEALAREGHEARVDHRSLAVRAKEALDRGDVEKALLVEERNGRWDRLKAELRRLTETLRELVDRRARIGEWGLRSAGIEVQQQARQRQQRLGPGIGRGDSGPSR